MKILFDIFWMSNSKWIFLFIKFESIACKWKNKNLDAILHNSRIRTSILSLSFKYI